MVEVTLICVGKLKEAFYRDACAEYAKRLSAYCQLRVLELPEQRKSDAPSKAEIDAALLREAEAIRKAVPRGAAVIALCVEGREMSSEALSETLSRMALTSQKLC